MENNIKKTNSICLTDDERLLISRACELFARCDYSAVASYFLTPREQMLLYRYAEPVRSFGYFFGGAPGATRRRLVFLPEYVEKERNVHGVFSPEREDEFISLVRGYGLEGEINEMIVPLKIKGSGYRELSHRDFLGSLMGLGIKRQMLGDIVFFEAEVYVFCDNAVSEFISEELKFVGRDKIKIEKAPLPESFKIENKFEVINQTVQSLRLDGVVRALVNISRDDSAAAVLRGDCEVNYFTEYEVDKKINSGDIISVRGYGKYIIEEIGSLTKKGRIKLTAKRFI